jgi:hypothetical protein
MIYRMFTAAAGTASIDIRDPGKLIGVCFSISNLGGVNGRVELSFNSTPSFTTNDVTGTIGSITFAQEDCQLYIPMNEPIDVGERLFCHSSSTAEVYVTICTDTQTVRAATRRR